MKRSQTLLAIAGALALALAVPALGGPSNPVAGAAGGLKGKVASALATADRALTSANGAQSAANNAQAAANAAQVSANAANAAAANALSAAQGKQDPVRWAFVQADGTITAQSGGISVTSAAGGFYILDLGSSQLNKAIVATSLGGSDGETHAALCGGNSNPGGQTCGMGNDTNHIRVITSDSAGALTTGLSFWVAVIA